jgi:hypothetical protein
MATPWYWMLFLIIAVPWMVGIALMAGIFGLVAVIKYAWSAPW